MNTLFSDLVLVEQVAITPIPLSPSTDADTQTAVSNWITGAIQEPQ